jgi:hypothetical protein
MTLRTALVSLVAIAFAVVVFLWEFGGDRILSCIGCFVIRVLTFNRVKILADRIDNTAEMSVGAVTLIFFVVAFIVLSWFIH